MPRAFEALRHRRAARRSGLPSSLSAGKGATSPSIGAGGRGSTRCARMASGRVLSYAAAAGLQFAGNSARPHAVHLRGGGWRITGGYAGVKNRPGGAEFPASLRRFAEFARTGRRQTLRESLSVRAAGRSRLHSRASSGPRVIEKVVQFFEKVLPSKPFAEKVETEVDAAALMVQEGATIVTHIAQEVEALSNAAELGAEDVEKAAQKVEQFTDKIKKLVDDVGDGLNGAKATSSLVPSAKRLKRVAIARRDRETDPATAETDK